ncbi:hypothetical protein MLD38_029198 [Melastoma candidum]|uniref:Uncharacterized protein n=2 Tax=Melastoma candidum TaxID=119954 RepID=A0ACB9N2Y0_9MYRT|nr:hypothetical protein MLD38_029194 [Melastoma candidum]KAI4330962.1 hypothetical protein MLD38_029198 [Melastoma candidum]
MGGERLEAGGVTDGFLEEYSKGSIPTEAEDARMTEVLDVVNELIASIIAAAGHTPGGTRIQIWIGEAAVVVAVLVEVLCLLSL